MAHIASLLAALSLLILPVSSKALVYPSHCKIVDVETAWISDDSAKITIKYNCDKPYRIVLQDPMNGTVYKNLLISDSGKSIGQFETFMSQYQIRKFRVNILPLFEKFPGK